MKLRYVIAALLVVTALAWEGELHADPIQRAPKMSAPVGELSLMGSFSKTDYGNGTYSTSRHYTATLGWNFGPVDELEVSYSASTSFFNADPVQTTSTYEESLGFTLVQGLTPAHSSIQPYLKGGVGQYDRTESGTVSGVATTPIDTKSPTGILGGGLRVFFFRSLSIKVEGICYLPNFNISGAPNNFWVQGGLGFQF